MKNARGGLIIIFALLIVAIPLLAPGPFIVLGIVVWLVTYLIVFFMTLGHDLTNTVPWMVVENTRFIEYLVLLALFGLLRGPLGSLALLATWGPLIAFPSYLSLLNVATANEHGWTGYLYDNYADPRCAADWEAEPDAYGKHPVYCTYVPQAGRHLPSFVLDESEKVVRTLNQVQ